MAREKAPAFQFYPKDFLTDSRVAAMTLQECGAYIKLLCHCWLEGSLSNSKVVNQHLLRLSFGRFEKIWHAVGPCFQEVEGGRLVQKRLERERLKQQSFRDLQATRGKARIRGAIRDKKGRMVSSRNPAWRTPLAGGTHPAGNQPESSSSISVLRTYVPESTEHSLGASQKPAGPVIEFLTWFQGEYRDRRHGADYLVKWDRDGALVKQMLGATTLERLKLLAQVMLSDKCGDEFIIETDRGISILSVKFNWLSDRLAQWEQKRGTG